MVQALCMTNRELKRVPMDFDWPLKKTWHGYVAKKHFDPPEGRGYQCWETTSEGSPISPVFKTLDELCEWLVDRSGGFTTGFTKEDWLKTLGGDSIAVDMATNKPYSEDPK